MWCILSIAILSTRELVGGKISAELRPELCRYHVVYIIYSNIILLGNWWKESMKWWHAYILTPGYCKMNNMFNTVTLLLTQTRESALNIFMIMGIMLLIVASG